MLAGGKGSLFICILNIVLLQFPDYRQIKIAFPTSTGFLILKHHCQFLYELKIKQKNLTRDFDLPRDHVRMNYSDLDI